LLRRLCFWHGVASFQDAAALAVASLDLELVKLLRGAMRAADIGAGGRGVLTPDPVIEPRRHLTPEPEYLPRQVIHPTPRYEPRPVIHPTPRLEPEPCPPPCPAPPPSFNPLPPPWKMVVWKNPIPPQPILKVVQYKTDIHNKGSLLDVFV
jgi:hypothetical protein